jgi:predicted transcriptional regulator
MARLANKGVLAMSRDGRADLYRPVASDAAGIAVPRLLAQFGNAAIKPFVDRVCAEPKLRRKLRAALSLSP